MKILGLILALIVIWVGFTVLYWPPLAVIAISTIIYFGGQALDSQSS